MATFRTKQLSAMSFIIREFAEEAACSMANETADFDTLNSFVAYLVLNFARDNKLFNERMFRGGCGEYIKQTCILKPTVKIANNVRGRMYNGRFI